jgi:hypothetical protein
LLGLVGAALALIYYLLFIILVVVLIALVAIPREGRRGALRRVGAVCGGIAALTAVFWVPLVGVLVNGSASQGHFLRPDFLQVSVGLGGPLALAVLAVVAIAMLGVTFSSPASQAVAGVLAGTVLYQLVSVTTLVFSHNQLQPHRAVAMMWATYGAAAPVALEGLRSPGAFLRGLPPAVPRALAALTLAVSGSATFVLGGLQGSDLAGGPFARAAHRRLAFPQTAAISRFITQTTGKRPQQLTVLTGEHALLVTEPYYGFLPLRFRYAHPEADVDQRIALLRAAAACPDPACTTRRLTVSRFGAIDAMVLARVPAGYRIESESTGFPRPVHVVITFRPGSFDPAVWVRRDYGPYTAFVRRPIADGTARGGPQWQRAEPESRNGSALAGTNSQS